MNAAKVDDVGVDLEVQNRKVKEWCVGSVRDNSDLNMKIHVIREKFLLRWYRRLVTRSFARYLTGVYREDWVVLKYTKNTVKRKRKNEYDNMERL